jgi:hypothetical protein
VFPGSATAVSRRDAEERRERQKKFSLFLCASA